MSIVTYNNRSIANISSIPGAAKSLTHIKTLTASSSSTISFVNGSSDVVLDSTYPIYMFKFINMHPATNNVDFQFNASIDSGSNYNVTKTTTQFNAYHNEAGNDQVLGYNASYDLAQSTAFQNITNDISNESDMNTAATLTIYDPANTTFVKHFMATTNNNYNSGGYFQNDFLAGYFNTTSALNAIQFKMSSGNVDDGIIKLYGIKDS
jgi:hypothetical protein